MRDPTDGVPCESPVCGGTPHQLFSVLVVWCPHTQSWTVHYAENDDQVLSSTEEHIHLGPFDSARDALAWAAAKLIGGLDSLVR